VAWHAAEKQSTEANSSAVPGPSSRFKPLNERIMARASPLGLVAAVAICSTSAAFGWVGASNRSAHDQIAGRQEGLEATLQVPQVICLSADMALSL
jgi:hypothetical protein